MRRASTLNQSCQDVGIVSYGIEQPIRVVLEDQSSKGATCDSCARPATFRRDGRGGGEEMSLSTYPLPQAAGANPLLKQLAKLLQATSPLIKPSARRHRRLFVPVIRMVVTSTTHMVFPVTG
ncbi:MAG: hypothetical protein OJF51_003963 [Nitrospira sp.]|nr:MAG: hypothetical protein OJF51_003963 [Nitrospira sp.]